MARIALYKEPEQLRSGNQYLQPAQFRLADSGVAQGLSKIAGVASNLSVKLMKQKQDLDDATTEIDLDKYLSEDALERQKWFQENSGNDQIEKDGTNRWEQRARDDAARAIDYWANVPMSAETRLRVNARLANYSDKAITTAWGSSLQQRGQNFTSTLGSLREQAQQTGDFTQYNAALDTIQRTNVFSPEQQQGFKMDRDNLMTNVEIQKLNVDTKDLVDTGLALNDPQYFNEAQQKWKEAGAKGWVKSEEVKFQINQIEYKAKLGQRVKDLEKNIEMQPDKVIEAANTPMGTSASLGQIRSKYGQDLQDPMISQQLFELTEAEVGGQSREAQIAFMETIVNRAAVTGKSIKQIMDEADSSGKHYYEPYNSGAIGVARASLKNNPTKRVQYSDIAMQVLAGSNLTKGATDNASADVAASVKQGGYDSVVDSVVDVGGETFYAKRGRTRLTAKEGEQVLPNGIDLTWASPSVRDAAVFKAQQNIAANGSRQFGRLKDVIDTSIEKPDFNFDEELKKEDYRILRSDPVLVDAIGAYHKNQKDKTNINDTSNYERLYAAINAYDPEKDASRLKSAQLGAAISANFTGDFEQRLKSHLNDITDNAAARATTSITSDAISQLNKLAYKDYALGKYTTTKTVPVENAVTEKKYGFFGWDWLAADVKGPANLPVVKVQETKIKNPVTGKIETQKQTVDVEEEDANLRLQVAEKQAAIRNQLEVEVRSKIPVPGLGVIDTRDKAVKRMIQIAREYQVPMQESKAGIMPTAPAAGTSGAAPIVDPQMKKKNVMSTLEALKQRQNQ